MLNALLILFFFSFTIFIHELGHFLVARKLGLKIDAFSIGFGPALWKRTVNGVTYKFSMFPLGGYVALPQMDPTGSSLEKKDQPPLPAVAPWRKIAVALAGVTGNVLLAFPLAYIVYVMGKPADLKDLATKIGYVETNSVLFAQGLRPGDEITAINDQPVKNWEDVLFNCAMETNIQLHIQSGTATKVISLSAGSVTEAVKLLDGASPIDPATVDSAMPGSSAEKAGLKHGDEIVALDGVPVYSRGQMITKVNEAKDRELTVTIRRNGTELDVKVTPTYNKKEKRALIGILFEPMVVHPTPSAQINEAAQSVFKILRRLVTPRYSGRAFEALGGAPMIIFSYWQMLKVGLLMGISFSVMLNINLAILNLLPSPVLDGGHIVLSLVEWIRGAPVGRKVVSALWQGSAVVLISFMIMMIARDFYRINIWHRDEVAAEQAAEKAADQSAPHATTPVPAHP